MPDQIEMCCRCSRPLAVDEAIDCGVHGVLCDNCSCQLADEEATDA